MSDDHGSVFKVTAGPNVAKYFVVWEHLYEGIHSTPHTTIHLHFCFTIAYLFLEIYKFRTHHDVAKGKAISMMPYNIYNYTLYYDR